MGSMLAPLLAALVCVMPSSAGHATDGAASVGAMSLPVDAGAELASLPRDESPAADAELLSPSVIECVATAVAPSAEDCGGGLSSHWTADMIGSCDMPLPARGRPATLRPARARVANRTVAGDSVSQAPEGFVPDSHSAPWLPATRTPFSPTLFAATLPTPPAGTPPSPPARRIDRPPRA
jgi:hypothetical protein